MFENKIFEIHGQKLSYEQLLHSYSHVIAKCVRSVLSQGQLPGYVDKDDLTQEGILALYEAARRFDASVGVKFPTFAQQRVYGAMIDHLRDLDWAPRTVRQKKKKVEQAEHELTVIHKRVPTQKEVADHLGWTEDELAEAHARASKTGILSLDLNMGEGSDDGGHEANLANTLHDTAPPVGHDIENEQIREIIDAGILEVLNAQEQKVFILHFIDHKPLKAITYDINLSESRVSQIRTKALQKLRAALREKQVELIEHGVDIRELGEENRAS